MTFVVLQSNNAAPQSNPIQSSPIQNKSLTDSGGDDYLPSIENNQFKLQLGAIGGDFGDNQPPSLHYLITGLKKQEISFERSFLWGVSITSNQMLEIKTQIDLNSLCSLNSPWDNFGIGLSQFIIGRDGISNLININQTKFTFYSDLGPYVQIQAYYGFKGLAYSLNFQAWF